MNTIEQNMVGTAVLGDVNWVMVVSASVLAGLLSLLTSVGGLPEEGQRFVHDLAKWAAEYAKGKKNPDE